MRNLEDRYRMLRAEAERQWASLPSLEARLRARADRFRRVAEKRWNARHDTLARKLVYHWDDLPAQQKLRSANLVYIRRGIVLLSCFIVGGCISTISHGRNPLAIVSLYPAIAALLFIGWYGRRSAILLGNTVLNEYAAMLPEDVERLRNTYGEEGIIDLWAPWVRRKASFVKKPSLFSFRQINGRKERKPRQ